MPGLSLHEWTLLAILAGALLAILSNRVRPDLAALFVLVGLGLGGVLPAAQLLAGFSNSAVVAIGALFVITAALERTGVVAWLGEALRRASRGSERRMLLLFMGGGALLALGMANLAAVAILLPAAVRAGRASGVRVSRLLLPLAFSTLLGGMATLWTTANLILSGALVAQGGRALTMLDFLPTGGLVALVGIAFLATAGRHLIPDRESLAGAVLPHGDLSKTYQLAERLWEVRILPGSPLVGQPLVTAVIGSRLGVAVLAVLRGRELEMPPPPTLPLASGDILLAVGREERVRQLELEGTVVGRTAEARGLAPRSLPVALSEVLVAPRSPALGQTLKQLHFRQKFGLTALALWRGGRSFRTDVGDFELAPGDALLMIGPRARAQILAQEPGFIVLDPSAPSPPLGWRGLFAAAITVLALALSSFGVAPAGELMLAGAALLLATRCLDMEDAYRAVEWRVLVVIVGLMPLGTALVATGLADRLGHAMASGLHDGGPLSLVALLYLAAVALTQVVGGPVAALVMSPIALAGARALAVDPAAVAVTVAIGCSTAFLTPIAHPVNVLVMGPGGYRPRDFLRVGAALTAVCFLALLAGLALFWRL